jgi:aryl-alcohol dehydrogenase-like predicted oxidoreductase
MNHNKIVIGTWALSGDYGYIDLYDINEILNYSYNHHGFKEYDTAPSYGNGFAEFCLGNFFYGVEDVLINTKIGNVPFKGKNFDILSLKESFEQSLARLKRDNINILYLHNPREDINYELVLNYMKALKNEGRIRYIGLSKAKDIDYSIWESEFDVIQDDYNLLRMPKIDNNYHVFMARSPLASGLLSGSIKNDTIFKKGDSRNEWLKGKRLEYLLEQIEGIKNIITSYDISLSTVAKRYVLHKSFINKVIFGVKNKNHITELLLDMENPLPHVLETMLYFGYTNNFGVKYNHKLNY